MVRLMVQDLLLLLLLLVVDLNPPPPVFDNDMVRLMAQRGLLVVRRPLPSTLGSSNGMARLQVVPPLVDLDHSHGDYPSAPNHHFVNSSIMATLVILLVLVMIVHELQVQWQNEFLL